MAASSPSEYEKPPIGSAGDASQISCSRQLVGAVSDRDAPWMNRSRSETAPTGGSVIMARMAMFVPMPMSMSMSM